MSETKYFDPSETIRGIQQILESDKKKIAFLFGAGTSLARRDNNIPFVPAIGEMTKLLEAEIIKNAKLKPAVDEIKAELTSTPLGFNVETFLTNVEDKIRVMGSGTLNTLNKNEFRELATQIRKNILNIVSVHKKINSDSERLLVHYDFATWIKSADRKHAIEIYTTNYDYLFEIGLEAADVPYYDGFTGSYKPFFNADSLEDMSFLPRQTKLWKIHGSLSFHENPISDSKKKVVRETSDLDNFLIYPSSLKYSDSKKMPYAAFMDRLNKFLKQDDAVLFVCGYSFGDEHINERIISALNTNSTAHVFVFFYDIVKNNDSKNHALTPSCKLAQLATSNRKISVLGTRNAVIGASHGIWKLKREPDKDDSLNVNWYFDEDAPINIEAALKDEEKGNEIWTGEGELILPDFTRFVDFLKNMILPNEWEGSPNG